MIAQALTPSLITPKPSTFSRKTTIISQSFVNLSTNSTNDSPQPHIHHVPRRDIALGLASVVLGLSVGGGEARAAARRPPPPPPTEKKDPNISGVLAKVLASKKRKEAMKESIAKLREKGKTIQEGSSDQ